MFQFEPLLCVIPVVRQHQAVRIVESYYPIGDLPPQRPRTVLGEHRHLWKKSYSGMLKSSEYFSCSATFHGRASKVLPTCSIVKFSPLVVINSNGCFCCFWNFLFMLIFFTLCYQCCVFLFRISLRWKLSCLYQFIVLLPVAFKLNCLKPELSLIYLFLFTYLRS